MVSPTAATFYFYKSPEPVESDLALHQGFLEPSPEPSPEPCWTWPGSAPKPPRLSPQPSPEPCWTWPGSPPKPPRPFAEPFLGTLLSLTGLCTKASGNLLRNFLGNPVEPDLALHPPRPSPQPSPEPCWTWPGSPPKPPRPFAEPFWEHCWAWPGSAPKPPGTFSGTFLGTLLNMTWLCTKASETFSGTFSETLLNLTWLCTKASQTFSETFSGMLLNLTWLCTKAPDLLRNPLNRICLCTLHQGFLQPSPEPSPEPCWTWPGSAPKPPRPSPQPSPEPCWTWPGSPPKPPRPFAEPSDLLRNFLGTWPGFKFKASRTLLNLAWLRTKASQTFSGTFSETLLNLALHQSLPGLLRNLLRNPVEPDLALLESLPELLWNLRNFLRNLVEPDITWPGVCTSAHRSYSGLKTLSYAVGKKTMWRWRTEGKTDPSPRFNSMAAWQWRTEGFAPLPGLKA